MISAPRLQASLQKGLQEFRFAKFAISTTLRLIPRTQDMQVISGCTCLPLSLSVLFLAVQNFNRRESCPGAVEAKDWTEEKVRLSSRDLSPRPGKLSLLGHFFVENGAPPAVRGCLLWESANWKTSGAFRT